MKRRRDVSAMLRLKARGWGLRRIAAKLRCSRSTVRRWLAQGEWRPHPSRSRPAKLDGLSDWLRERFFSMLATRMRCAKNWRERRTSLSVFARSNAQ